MARTKNPTRKNKDYNGPFPLQDDKEFLRLKPVWKKFVYNVFLKPVSGWSTAKCYQEAYDKGVTDKAAGEAGCGLLKHPKIKSCLDKVARAHAEALGFSAERVLQELAALSFSDLGEYFDEEGYLTTNPRDLPKEARSAIAGFSSVPQIGGGHRYKVTLWSKTDALKQMMKIHGMEAPKKLELSGPGGGPIETKVAHAIDLSDLSGTELDVLLKLVERNGEQK